MRGLWPIEKVALESAAQVNSTYADAIRRQAATAQVRSFQNTGAGFFSELFVADEAPLLIVRSPLECALGTVNGLQDAMGFLVFLKGGRLTTIEGYRLALDQTVDIDFETVDFKLQPYDAGYG